MQRLTRGAASIAARASKGAVGSTALKVAAATIPRRAYFAETLRLKPINSESKTTDTPTYITDANGKTISPWHDIPLRRAGAPNLFNFVCEIPRGTTPKYEVRNTISPKHTLTNEQAMELKGAMGSSTV